MSTGRTFLPLHWVGDNGQLVESITPIERCEHVAVGIHADAGFAAVFVTTPAVPFAFYVGSTRNTEESIELLSEAIHANYNEIGGLIMNSLYATLAGDRQAHEDLPLKILKLVQRSGGNVRVDYTVLDSGEPLNTDRAAAEQAPLPLTPTHNVVPAISTSRFFSSAMRRLLGGSGKNNNTLQS